MGKSVFLILIVIFLFSVSSVRTQKNIPEEKFISLLLEDSEDALSYISPDEIKTSQRLNTKFVDVNSKLLLNFSSSIRYDIKERIKKGEAASFETTSLGDNYSKSVLNVPALNYSVAFYFQNHKAITPLTYFTRNWKKQYGKYFNFLISDEELFNPYCIDMLDEFVEKTAILLKYRDDELQLLGEKKILYIFCRNFDEIEDITGSISKGRYLSELDAVVTTYTCHFHEVAHLLLNYKIKENSLYPIPFLQEGFAVATGGRGGQGNKVLNDVGYFIARYNYANYKTLFEYENFMKEDLSISYPLSGIFSKFLLETMSIEDYLAFYNQTEIDTNQKIFYDFNNYIAGYKSFRDITFTPRSDVEEIIADSSFFLTPENPIKNYTSIKFNELFTSENYKSEKYYFAIDKKEINIYNLYSNELIASYVNSFADNPVEYFANGKYKFYISETLLDESLSTLNFSYR
jgi:hypothetical protein